MSSEKRILAEGLLAIQAPDLLAWRNNTGRGWVLAGQGRMLRPPNGSSVRVTPGMVILTEAMPISFGLQGSGDILGVAPGFGFALEAKADSGRQSEQQKKFQMAFERAGGRYGLFRSADEAVALMRGWRNGAG